MHQLAGEHCIPDYTVNCICSCCSCFYCSYVAPLNHQTAIKRWNEDGNTNGSHHSVTTTYVSIFPVTLPTAHTVSRTDQKVNFDWRNPNTHEAEFQCTAYIVSRYYCELINQLRKHSKYPVPVFVPQQTTGLTIINTCFRVCMHEMFHTFIIFVLLCLCASACVHVPMHAHICACFYVNTNKEGW